MSFRHNWVYSGAHYRQGAGKKGGAIVNSSIVGGSIIGGLSDIPIEMSKQTVSRIRIFITLPYQLITEVLKSQTLKFIKKTSI